MEEAKHIWYRLEKTLSNLELIHPDSSIYPQYLLDYIIKFAHHQVSFTADIVDDATACEMDQDNLNALLVLDSIPLQLKLAHTLIRLLYPAKR